MDTFNDVRHFSVEDGKQRSATALMFLNAPEEGGETVFPNIAANNSGPGYSPCARDALAHKPQTGDLILFFSLAADGTEDIGATHTACPVIKGEKARAGAPRAPGARGLPTLTPPAAETPTAVERAAVDPAVRVPAALARRGGGQRQQLRRHAQGARCGGEGGVGRASLLTSVAPADVRRLGCRGRVREEQAVHAGRLQARVRRVPVPQVLVS